MGCSASQAASAAAARPSVSGGSAAADPPPQHLDLRAHAREEQDVVPAEPPKCRNGCVMVPVGRAPPSERHYACSRCGGRSSCGHLGGDKTRRWRCQKCDHDVCYQCHPDKHLVHKETVVPEPDPLTRCTTVEVKRTLDRQLRELGGVPVLAAEAAAPSASAPTGMQRSMPEANSEEDFLHRCHAALREQIAAGDAGSAEASASPSPASSTLLQRRTRTQGKASEPRAFTGATPHDALAPDPEFARVEAELKRRTLEVQRILQGHVEAFESGGQRPQPRRALQGAGPSPGRLALDSGEDERATDVPELSRAPRGGGCVACTCLA